MLRCDPVGSSIVYCFPLAMGKPRLQLLLQWVINSPILVEEIYLNGDDEEQWPIGKGFEVPLGSIWWGQLLINYRCNFHLLSSNG